MTASTTASSVLAPGLASGLAGSNPRLRRGSASFDERRSSVSSTTALNAANLHALAANTTGSSAGSPAGAAAALRRRSSNFSDYSQEARDLLNPRPPLAAAASSSEALRHHEPTSSWDALPLAFALLPAVGGLLVQGGSSFVTDLMLLGLGGIFLHWSVTQPWTWYHAAQQIREEHEESTKLAVPDDSDSDDSDDALVRPPTPTPTPTPARTRTPSPLEDVQEEEEAARKAHGADDDGEKDEKDEKGEKGEKSEKSQKSCGGGRASPTPDERVAAYNAKQRARRRHERRSLQARQTAALRELYRHEVLALLACVVSPVVGASLLHALRGQLSRPSEGLISNFNLTIFLLGAELRPLRHLLQLVQVRTLHLQRVVHANPFREDEERYRERREDEERLQNQTLSDLLQRLDDLETQVAAAAAAAKATAATATPASPNHAASTSYFAMSPPPPLHRSPSDAKRDRDQLLRDLRAQLQPELDSLARALRRTHKQQTLLEGQLAAKFRSTDQRLSDAVSLASTAAAAAAAATATATSTATATVAGRGSRESRDSRGAPGPFRRSSHRPLPLSLGSLVDAVWAALLCAAETALAAVLALLYVPRKLALAAAAVALLPAWAVRSVVGGPQPDAQASSRADTPDTPDGPLRAGYMAVGDIRRPWTPDLDHATGPLSRARRHRGGLA